jgi:hypothetical protein
MIGICLIYFAIVYAVFESIRDRIIFKYIANEFIQDIVTLMFGIIFFVGTGFIYYCIVKQLGIKE